MNADLPPLRWLLAPVLIGIATLLTFNTLMDEAERLIGEATSIIQTAPALNEKETSTRPTKRH